MPVIADVMPTMSLSIVKDQARIIEMLLIEALERICQVPPIVKNVDELNSKEIGLKIGHAICELHDVRDELYKCWPDLKPEIAKEVEDNFDLFMERSKEIEKAFEFEESGRLEEAEVLFEEVRNKAESKHFKVQAEAALFRIMEKKQA